MASTTGKRARPHFSPPRPKASKQNGVSKPASKSTKSTKKSNIGSIFNTGASTSKSKPKPSKKARRRSPSVEEEVNENEDEEEGSDDSAEDSARRPQLEEEDDDDEDDDNDGPSELDSEPDFILAEVTHDNTDSSTAEPSIPPPLLQRLLHHSYTQQESTRLSSDARAAVGKYIDVFIREGIYRCALEFGEKRTGDTGLRTRDDGWLEVEDLERVGGQLVLDF